MIAPRPRRREPTRDRKPHAQPDERGDDAHRVADRAVQDEPGVGGLVGGGHHVVGEGPQLGARADELLEGGAAVLGEGELLDEADITAGGDRERHRKRQRDDADDNAGDDVAPDLAAPE